MTDTPTIKAPRVTAVYEQEDGQLAQVTVQTDQRDQFAFSMLRRSDAKIPDPRTDPALWGAYLTWHALRRSGVPEATGHRWDEFLGEVLVSCEMLGDPNGDVDVATPLEQTA